MKAVILAGGKGTRLAPYTTILPKPLMPIGEMPILTLLLKQLRQHGIVDVVLAIGHLGPLIQAVVGDGRQFGVDVTYSTEIEPLGTAGPLHNVIDRLNGDFLVMNGDLLTTLNIGRLLAHHRARAADATIATYQRDVKIDFGLIERDAAGNFLGYHEKPNYRHFVSMGLYVLKTASVRKFLGDGIFLDMPDLLLKLHSGGHRVCCFDEECFWLDIGRPEDYRLANEIFEKRPEDFLASG